jgi:hypothetical protein
VKSGLEFRSEHAIDRRVDVYVCVYIYIYMLSGPGCVSDVEYWYLSTKQQGVTFQKTVISIITVMWNSKPILPLNSCFLFIAAGLICPLSYWITFHQLQRSNMERQKRCVGKNEINLQLSFILNRLNDRITIICHSQFEPDIYCISIKIRSLVT